MSQTSIQKSNAIRKGSVKVEIGTSLASLVNLGAIRDPKMQLMVEQQNIEFDNVDDLRQFAEGDKVQVSFVLTEINFTNFALLDSGLVTVTPVAGTPVVGATQVVAAASKAFNEFIPLTNQMGDGTANTITTVVGATDGALVSETDYFKGKDAQGRWGIFIKDSVTVTTMNQVFTITYNYTPNASKTVTFTKLGTKVLVYARITNTDSNSKKLQVDLQNVTNIIAPNIDFAADDEAEIAVVPVTLEGYITSITDEQQTT